MMRPFPSSFADVLKPITGWRGLLVVLGLALAWHALRNATWAEAWDHLTGLGPWGFLLLFILNLLLLPLMTARWWLLLRILGRPVGLFSACRYRCAASAISSLTPGPHCGGEPLAVYLLHQRQEIPLPLATTSVALDRILELLASIMVLALGLFVLTATGSSPFSGARMLPVVLALLAVLAVLLAGVFSGRRPFSRFVSWGQKMGSRGIAPSPGRIGLVLDALIQGEVMAESLWRTHRGSFLLANLLSLVHWLGVFTEFWLMAALMGHPLSLVQVTAVVITARLAFLTPLPAGLGVLEAALPWVTDTLGMGSALGLSLCLLIRFRDLLFSLAGLTLAMKDLTCSGKALSVMKNVG
jgi:uncharacterized protein (TIRG00374 family)